MQNHLKITEFQDKSFHPICQENEELFQNQILKKDIEKNGVDIQGLSPQKLTPMQKSRAKKKQILILSLMERAKARLKLVNFNYKILLQDPDKYSEELHEESSYNGKVEILCKHNKTNNIAFYQYLLSLQVLPANNFLQMISQVIDSEDLVKQKLRIFLGICGLYKGGPVTLDSKLYQPMLEYLAFEKNVTMKQAIGFLRIIFQNNISLSQSPLKTLKAFDQKFSHQFDQVYQCLQNQFIHSQVIFGVLPKTCLVMTIPMIKGLKQEKDHHSIFSFIPPDFVKPIIDIFVHTFGNDQEAFDDILMGFNFAFSNFYERLETTSFVKLLQELIQKLINHDPYWYQNLENVKELLTGALKMVEQNKIQAFNKEICEALLTREQKPMNFLQKPTQIEITQNNSKEFLDIVTKINQNNPKIKSLINLGDISQIITKNFTIVFDHLNISPTQVQEMCIKLSMCYSHLFLSPGVGMGKTTLLCALAIGMVIQYKKTIFFLNSDITLLYRDFKRVKDLILEMSDQNSCLNNVEVTLFRDFEEKYNWDGIFFLTPQQFIKIDRPAVYYLLLDEFHVNVFSDEVFNLAPLIESALQFVGTSGSPMKKEHTCFVQDVFKKGVVIQFPDQYEFNSQDKKVSIYRTKQMLVNGINKLANEQKVFAPVILIMDEDLCKAYQKLSEKKKGSMTLLFGDDCSSIQKNFILQNRFNQKLEDSSFGVYITDRLGGTGTDFLSSPEIEENGGVRVVICIKPTTYGELCQFRRRTARMTNKGIVYFQILDKKYAGLSQNYITELETVMKEQEYLHIKGLHRRYKKPILEKDSNSSQLREDHNKQKGVKISSSPSSNNTPLNRKNDSLVAKHKDQIGQNSLTIKNKAIQKKENCLQDEGNPEYKGDCKNSKQIIFQGTQAEKSDIEINFLSNIDPMMQIIPQIIQQEEQEIKEDQNLTLYKEVSNIQQMIKEPNKQHNESSNQQTSNNQETLINQKQKLLQPNQFQDTDIDKESDSSLQFVKKNIIPSLLLSNELTIQDQSPEYFKENEKTQESHLKKVNEVAFEKEKKELTCPQNLQEMTEAKREIQVGALNEYSELNNIKSVKMDLLKHPFVRTEDQAHNILKRSAYLNHTAPSLFQQKQNKRDKKFLDKAEKMPSHTDSESVKKLKIISKERVTKEHDNTKKRQKTSLKLGKPNLHIKQLP